MKNDGIDAIVACQVMAAISIAADTGCFTDYHCDGTTSTYNDRYVQNHIWNLLGGCRPERIDQLPQGCPQWIGQRCNGCCADAPSIGKPKIAVPRRRTQAEWLRETDKELPKHGHTKDASTSFRSGISNPVAHEQECGCSDDGRFGTAFVKSEDDNWAGDAKGKKIAGAHPIDGAFRDTKMLRCGSGYRRKGEPLSISERAKISQILVLRLFLEKGTYVPADDNIQQN